MFHFLNEVATVHVRKRIQHHCLFRILFIMFQILFPTILLVSFVICLKVYRKLFMKSSTNNLKRLEIDQSSRDHLLLLGMFETTMYEEI